MQETIETRRAKLEVARQHMIQTTTREQRAEEIKKLTEGLCAFGEKYFPNNTNESE